MTRMSNKLGFQFWKSLKEIVELLNRGKFLCCKIFVPFIDCGDTEWKTEENSSVEKWKHLSYD